MAGVVNDTNDTGWDIRECRIWARHGTGFLGNYVAAICSHEYGGVLIGYGLCLNGHICFIVYIENAVRYARNTEHLPRTQHAIYGIPYIIP
jgi:hypothetical protein